MKPESFAVGFSSKITQKQREETTKLLEDGTKPLPKIKNEGQKEESVDLISAYIVRNQLASFDKIFESIENDS